MSHENQLLKTERFVIEVEVTASKMCLEKCKVTIESFGRFLNCFMLQRYPNLRVIWRVQKITPPPSYKSHSDVQLPKLRNKVGLQLK